MQCDSIKSKFVWGLSPNIISAKHEGHSRVSHGHFDQTQVSFASRKTGKPRERPFRNESVRICVFRVSELLDYTADELTGKNLYTLCHGEDANRLRKSHVDCEYDCYELCNRDVTVDLKNIKSLSTVCTIKSRKIAREIFLISSHLIRFLRCFLCNVRENWNERAYSELPLIRVHEGDIVVKITIFVMLHHTEFTTRRYIISVIILYVSTLQKLCCNF